MMLYQCVGEHQRRDGDGPEPEVPVRGGALLLPRLPHSRPLERHDATLQVGEGCAWPTKVGRSRVVDIIMLCLVSKFKPCTSTGTWSYVQ